MTGALALASTQYLLVRIREERLHTLGAKCSTYGEEVGKWLLIFGESQEQYYLHLVLSR